MLRQCVARRRIKVSILELEAACPSLKHLQLNHTLLALHNEQAALPAGLTHLSWVSCPSPPPTILSHFLPAWQLNHTLLALHG